MRLASTSIEDSLIGTTLAGRYRIEARVGSGAMGAVYRAHQAGLARPVAIKILNRDRSVAGDTVQRFRREAQAMSALHHPNTVRVFDFGSTDDGLLYLAMELLEGESVTQRLLRGGALGVKEAVLIAQAVLRSVGEAHAHGIVHRDLKPDNIFLARVQGEILPVVKVLDFGIAKAVEGERKIDQFETLDGTVFGTPRYMSPEQAAGKPLDHRSDLYAVGIMLFEYLAGRPPFVDADAVVVMARHIRETPPPVVAAAPDAPIPPCLEEVVAKSLAKDPCERWQNAEEFERALARCLPDLERLQRLALRGWHKSWLAQLALTHPRRQIAWSLAAIAMCLSAGAAVALPNLLAPPETATLAVSGGSDGRPSGGHARNSSVPASDEQPRQLRQPQRVVTLESTPGSALVYRNGAEVGTTPVDIAVTDSRPVLVLLRKRGFADHSVELGAGDKRKSVALLPLPQRSQTVAAQARAQTSRRERERERERERDRDRDRDRDRESEHRSKAASSSANSTTATAPAESASPYEKF